MPLRRIRFAAAAKQELLAGVAYYQASLAGLGKRFASEVESATVRALAYPYAGSPSSAGTRKLNLKKFPFSIVYRPDTEGIVVLAVAHHSRTPGYWRDRTSN